MRSRSFRVGPADDDELGPVEAFGLDPRAAIAGQIGPVDPLRDDALEPVLAGRPAESLAVAVLMIAVGDPRRRVLEQRREPFLALEQRQARDVLAVEFEEVEGEIDVSPAPPRSDACCISSNEVTPSGRTPQSSPSR